MYISINKHGVDSEMWRTSCVKKYPTQTGKVFTEHNIIQFSLWELHQYFSCSVLVSNISKYIREGSKKGVKKSPVL